MKKRKVIIIVLKNNTPSSPSTEAKAEAAMHVVLDVQSSGAGQTGQF